MKVEYSVVYVEVNVEENYINGNVEEHGLCVIDDCVVDGDFVLTDVVLVNSIIVNMTDKPINLTNMTINSSYLNVTGDCDICAIHHSISDGTFKNVRMEHGIVTYEYTRELLGLSRDEGENDV
jgi:hypothetical protein